MTLSIVNTKPGNIPGVHIPGRTVEFGLRSSPNNPVRQQSLNVLFGHTGLTGKRKIPTAGLGSTVSLTTVNDISPVHSSATVSLGPELTIVKNTNSVLEAGVYKISVPCDAQNPILGVVRFQTPSSGEWSPASREWTETPNVLPPFFSLVHGGVGSGVMLYLQDAQPNPILYMEGLPREVVPGNSYGYPYARRALGALVGEPAFGVHLDPTTGVLKIYSVDANGGLADPLWEQRIVDLGPLGSVSADGAVLYFGNGGSSGSVVRVKEWGLYPDFRAAVSEGLSSSEHGMVLLPDSPHVYSPSDGYTPDDGLCSSWSPVGFSGTKINPSKADPTKADSFSIQRDDLPAYLFRAEPGLADNAFGCMLETSLTFPKLGLGEGSGILQIDDGTRKVVVFVQVTPAGNFLKFGDQSVPFTPETYSLVRIFVDRIRSKCRLLISNQEVASADFSEFDPSSGQPGFYVGFLGPGLAAEMKVRHLTYLNNYLSWESGPSALSPSSLGPEASFEQNSSGGSISVDGELVVDKSSANYGVGCTLFRNLTHRPEEGFWLEFSLRAESYSSPNGVSGYSNTGIGFSLDAYDRRLYLGFFECGPGGMKIGIVPGSGTADDIINETGLGLQFSAPADLSQDVIYRMEYIPRKSISVWSGGSRTRPPHIVIPWSPGSGGFDLPTGAGGREGISFGHFPSQFNAKTRWSFFRWGRSSGFDIGLTRAYLNGYPPYLFGGKFLTCIEARTVS